MKGDILGRDQNKAVGVPLSYVVGYKFWRTLQTFGTILKRVGAIKEIFYKSK